MTKHSIGTWILLLALAGGAWADGPKDNLPASVRPIPPMGIEIAPEIAKRLLDQTAVIERSMAELRQKGNPRAKELLPDVEIFTRAVRGAVEHREFFKKEEVGQAEELLRIAAARAAELAQGRASWTTATGLIVRGYRSKIDDTVQPYGLVVPPRRAGRDSGGLRCDVWLHGRFEPVCELQYIWQRLKQPGQFTPRDTLVLHPYGRYSNAFKFAGEVDVLEALDHVRSQYLVDDDRISIRGFSMGGAGCWQLAVHYPDRWFAANPGAGFSETPLFLKIFQDETLKPTEWEKTLWQWYDCPPYAVNLTQCPTVAYSGEIDRQKQAADVMDEALAAEGIDLLHLIGPKTAHSIHPDSKRIIEEKMASLAERGRQRVPRQIRFATCTLKYNRSNWVTVDAMERHWERAEVSAAMAPGGSIRVTTKNVAGLTLSFPAGWCPMAIDREVPIEINGVKLTGPKSFSDRSWSCSLVLSDGAFKLGALPSEGVRKRHDLQGPIDDAFMGPFVFVRPTGKFAQPAVEKWVRSEMNRAVAEWRRQFRGDARIVDDTKMTPELIASSNLVLWGDPASNAVLGKIADKLPIVWTKDKVTVGERSFAANQHAPVLIYPNPLNPERYVVLNSGFTYREYAYLNNARQVPMLPDWAIVDLTTPPDSRWPGRIVAADFFDEKWRVK